MKLVIVESPTKCTTIKKYLGDGYEVMASKGHICDLATRGKGGLGVDVDNDFAPTYINNKDKGAVINSLMSATRKADEVILATDPDREGEAIAWHLARVLGLDIATTKRLEFHEITRASITEAMNHPRTIDLKLVQAQETRRIIDRIIGFKLSNLIYKKINSRSAGRVQSVTLKIISDHDKEIASFIPEEYWNINVKTLINGEEFELSAISNDKTKIDLHNEESAKAVLDKISDSLVVTNVEKTFKTKESKEPFTTSTLQQEAFARLKFKTSKTQFIAQQLYEGIDVGGEHMGLITYMRTDSTRLSPTFIEHATAYILESFGSEYLGSQKKLKVTSNMQDAHEAIRPTSNHRTPESIKQYLTPDQYNLYKLIYNRAIASLMKGKKEEVLTVSLDSNGVGFELEFTRTVFAGYEALLKDLDDQKKNYSSLPEIEVGTSINVISKNAEQKFTQAPSHYSEAKVVKLMEELGIGRPSTYASTIETIQKRKYVSNSKGILTVTDQGGKTVDVLTSYFEGIMNVKYTANMEEKLDDIEAGKISSIEVLNKFYPPFIKLIDDANAAIEKFHGLKTGEDCPICGAPLVYKESKNGQFVGCSNYPSCKYIKPKEKEQVVLEYVGRKCPDCGSELVYRKDSKGRKFVACSAFPKCKYIEKQAASEPKIITENEFVKVCPDCGGQLVKKKGKYGYFLGCTNYPKCKHMEPFKNRKGK